MTVDAVEDSEGIIRSRGHTDALSGYINLSSRTDHSLPTHNANTYTIIDTSLHNITSHQLNRSILLIFIFTNIIPTPTPPPLTCSTVDHHKTCPPREMQCSTTSFDARGQDSRTERTPDVGYFGSPFPTASPPLCFPSTSIPPHRLP